MLKRLFLIIIGIIPAVALAGIPFLEPIGQRLAQYKANKMRFSLIINELRRNNRAPDKVFLREMQAISTQIEQDVVLYGKLQEDVSDLLKYCDSFQCLNRKIEELAWLRWAAESDFDEQDDSE